MATIAACKLKYPKPSWVWNPVYKWKFVGNTSVPVLNKDAIPEWENNIKVWQGAVHDYSAQIAMMQAHIAAAEPFPNEHAKNPFYHGGVPNDAAYVACRAS